MTRHEVLIVDALIASACKPQLQALSKGSGLGFVGVAAVALQALEDDCRGVRIDNECWSSQVFTGRLSSMKVLKTRIKMLASAMRRRVRIEVLERLRYGRNLDAVRAATLFQRGERAFDC